MDEQPPLGALADMPTQALLFRKPNSEIQGFVDRVESEIDGQPAVTNPYRGTAIPHDTPP